VKSVLVANSSVDELQTIKKILSNDFNVMGVNSPKGFGHSLEKADVLLLDQNFTPDSGIDILMEILPKTHLPVLVVASPEDSKLAIEAMRLGAYNYVVKTDNYYELLNYSIREATEKFNEKEELKRTIVVLKERVAELENKLRIGTDGDSEGTKESVQDKTPSEPKKVSIFQEITSRFKRGEINLPSYPQINVEFRKMISGGANVVEISELLKKDIGISSKLISMSNASYYRGVQENKTVEQAVNRLGLYETKNCVEMISNRGLFATKNPKFCAALNHLWKHSLSCGYASEIISKLIDLKTKDEIFTLGLLHDIGKLFLLQVVAELETKGAFGKEVDEMELELTIDTHHGAFGSALMKRWNFSEKYSQISLFHDNLDDADPVSKELLTVHLGNLLVKTMGYGQKEPTEIEIENAPSAKFLKVDAPTIDKIKDQVKEIMETAATL
jgi:HD-like signal output (HDOD) protein